MCREGFAYGVGFVLLVVAEVPFLCFLVARLESGQLACAVVSFVFSCTGASYIDRSSKLTTFKGAGEMSQKVRDWRLPTTAFEKRSEFSRRGNRPAGALLYLDLRGRTGRARSHSGAHKRG